MPKSDEPPPRLGRYSGEGDSASDLFQAARNGSGEALGQLLEGCRDYLLLIAGEELGKDLQAKAGASDLVQDTFLEAHVAFPRFAGTGERELLAWLRQILLNNLANVGRQYRGTQKRQIDREQPIAGNTSVGRIEELIQADTTSPSGKAIRHEEAALLEAALDRLPDDYGRALTLRHRQHCSFKEMGRLMDRSTDAARMLWWRAFEALAAELEKHNAERPR